MRNSVFAIVQGNELSLDLPASEKLVYIGIKSFCSNGKSSKDISSREIAERVKLGHATVSRSIPVLVKMGVIEVVGRKKRVGGSVPIYKIKVSQPETLNTIKVSQGETLSVSSRAKSVSRPGTKTIQSNKVSKSKCLLLTKLSPYGDNDFWELANETGCTLEGAEKVYRDLMAKKPGATRTTLVKWINNSLAKGWIAPRASDAESELIFQLSSPAEKAERARLAKEREHGTT